MLSGSRMPLFMHCSQSAVDPAIKIGHDSVAAFNGSVVHRALSRYVEIGQRTKFNDSELQMLFNSGAALWDENAPYMPNPMTEQKIDIVLAGQKIAGTLDVCSVQEDTALVYDHKSGRVETDNKWQNLFYALCVARALGCRRAWIMTGWLRSMSIERYAYDPDELDEAERRIADQLKSDAYSPGEHCVYCARRFECDARHAEARMAIRDLDGIDTEYAQKYLAVREIGGAKLREIDQRVKILNEAIKAWDEAKRTEIRAAGPLDYGNGEQLALVESPNGYDFDVPATLAILRERFGSEAVDTAIKLSAEGVKNLAGDAAPPKGKGKAIAALIEDLTASKAATPKTVFKLKVTKAEREISYELRTGNGSDCGRRESSGDQESGIIAD